MADDLFKINSGVRQKVEVKCAHGNRCLVVKALALRKQYFAELLQLDTICKGWQVRLENARFVNEVAQAAAKSKEIKAADVWKNLRPKTGRSDDPTSFEQSYLCEDIKRMEASITKQREAVEAAAKALVKFISTKDFQTHLYSLHRNHQISTQSIADVYNTQVDESSEKGIIRFRELDHYLALLTEHLAATKAGTEFLAKLLDENFISDANNLAFADIWKVTATVNSLTEPVGKFVYNVAPVLTGKIQKLVNEQKVKTINDILNDPDLKEHFQFLKKKLNFDVPGWLKKRSNAFADKAVKARQFLDRGNDWKNSVKEFQDVFDQADARKALDNAWVGLTLDTVAFAISVIKIASDFKKSEWKDWMGLVGDFTGFAKTVSEVNQSRILLTAGEGESLNAAKAFTKRLGVLAGVVSIILICGDIYQGIKGGDWDVIALNSAGLAITGIGIYAAFMEMALLSGICAVLAVVLAIITALVLDPKVIDYIEDTHWGEDFKSRQIPIGKSIHEYYKRMFEMKLRFIIDEYDKNDSHLMLECGMMADSTPVFVEVIDESSKKPIGKARLFPGNKDVEGKGVVEKDVPGWSENWPFYGKQIRIKRAWDIWTGANGIKRDGSTKYTIKAGMDPSRSTKMAIDKMAQHEDITGVVFPTVQLPILWGASTHWESDLVTVAHNGIKYCLPYPSSGQLNLKVATRYGSGCSIEIRAMEDCTWPASNKLLSKTTVSVSGDKTSVPVKISPPSSDGYYDMFAKVTLIDSNSKAIKSHTMASLRVATSDYIQKRKC